MRRVFSLADQLFGFFGQAELTQPLFKIHNGGTPARVGLVGLVLKLSMETSLGSAPGGWNFPCF